MSMKTQGATLTKTDYSTPAWVTMDQAGQYLSLSRDTVRRMIRAGELEARHFGKRNIRVSIASLEAAGATVRGAK